MRAKSRLEPLLAAIGGIYVTQSMVTGIAMMSVPALLRAAGVSLQWIGMASLFMLPWALKFLWAPMVERWRLPVDRPERRSRPLILAGQWLLAAVLLTTALFGALSVRGSHGLRLDSVWLMVALLIAAFLAATMDIACDGFAVDQLAAHQRGWGNVAQVGGSYLGIAIGGSAFLLVAQVSGWPAALASAGLLAALLTLPLLAVGEAPRPAGAELGHRPALRHAFGDAQVRRGLLLTLICGAGVRLAAGMLTPLLIDRGASVALVGLLNGVLGVGCGLAGTLGGGLLVRRTGACRAVAVAVALETAVLLALMLAAHTASVELLATLLGLKLAAMACAFVAIYSLLMGWASPRQAGVDFTLFQCADALIAASAGMAGGLMAHRWGYGACFAVATALSALATLYTVHLWTSRTNALAPPSAPTHAP
ncbi:MFS transporter [Paracidovorax avenae]